MGARLGGFRRLAPQHCDSAKQPRQRLQSPGQAPRGNRLLRAGPADRLGGFRRQAPQRCDSAKQPRLGLEEEEASLGRSKTTSVLLSTVTKASTKGQRGTEMR